ncbi:MAG TPA: NUDIX hydrolase [Verrucomicrobiae bacterium]|nr:NUDIX hydrolase [Verrucomicrobiae bacterium]
MQIDPRLPEIDDCLYRLAIRAFVFHNGKVLLVREKDAEWWSFPGGGIDYGEDIRQALPRELAEELGVSASDITTDYQITYLAIGAIVKGIPRANLFYRVEIPIEHIRAGNDVLDFGWFAPSEITPEITARYTSSAPEAARQFLSTIETQSTIA